MKKFTQDELNEIFRKHTLWLNDDDGGERANLHSANLRSANLHSADLRYADLRSANLRYANLHSADLRYADLRYANLNSADLRYADLRSADLRYANLNSADLRYANLRSANLHSADLSSANLDDKIYQLSRIGASNRMTTYNATKDIVWCGCFKGTMAEFEAKIELSHKDNEKYLSQYRLAVTYLKSLAELEK